MLVQRINCDVTTLRNNQSSKQTRETVKNENFNMKINLNTTPSAIYGKNSVNFGAKLDLKMPKKCVKALEKEFGLKIEEEFVTLTSYCSKEAKKIFKGFGDVTELENKLLSKVKSITGDADFESSQVTSLPLLEKIGGWAIFRNSKVTSLPLLEKIGGWAIFRNSKVTSLPRLREIGDDANFRESQVTSLPLLEKIGDDAYIPYSISLPEAVNIGGELKLYLW